VDDTEEMPDALDEANRRLLDNLDAVGSPGRAGLIAACVEGKRAALASGHISHASLWDALQGVAEAVESMRREQGD
jgi:hypothetical protein